MTAENHSKDNILLVGNDDRLAYLLKRFVEQGGWTMISVTPQVVLDEIVRLEAAAVIFDSIDLLSEVRHLVNGLADQEVPVLVCASIADESTAGELGADACLLHPLTYDKFCATLAAVCPARL